MAVQPTGAPAVDGEENDLRRALGPVHLTMLGIGAIIGAGIFVITGQAAAMYAGPGIMISFAIAGVGCLLAGLCYAEFAAMIPVAGSAYTYAYATLGPFVAWIIGWDLVLEYGAAAATVAVGWSGYFAALMDSLGAGLPPALTSTPIAISPNWQVTYTGAYLNAPAVILIGLLTFLLVVGIRASATFNNLMVMVKLAVVLLVIGFGLSYVDIANVTPLIPPNEGEFGKFGWSGVLRASGVIFFAYIGFDAVSVAAQEARNPQRDMPIGILGSLAICTVLYMLMSFVITGLAPYQILNVPNPVSVAVTHAGPQLAWLVTPVNVGATVGLGTVVLVLLLGQSRIFYAMSRDGLFFPIFSRIHPRYRTPYLGSIITGCFAAVAAGILPLNILGELVSIGTLAAFVIVCIGVLVLRSTAPHATRPFRTPLVPWVPLGGVAVCGAMMYWLPLDTWLRFVIWLFIGLIIYGFYGMRRAKTPRWSIKTGP
jgi:basic amino acid/polyamine antiporter, APA family